MNEKTMPMKGMSDNGPPKHLAYITEDEAKILDMVLTIKKNAKGKDGKPIPQTYNPGQGHPLEFLTELTGAQINELLRKTDGDSDMTKEGVPSFMMDGSYGSTDHTSNTGGQTTNSGSGSGGGGGGGNGIRGNSLGSAGASNYSGDGTGGQVNLDHVGGSSGNVLRYVNGQWQIHNKETGQRINNEGGAYDAAPKTVALRQTVAAPAPQITPASYVEPEVYLDPQIAGRLQSALATQAANVASTMAAKSAREDALAGSSLAGLARPGVYEGNVRYPSSAFNDNARQRSFGGYENSYDALANAGPNLATRSVPAGQRVTDVFTRDQVALDPSIAGRVQATRTPAYSTSGKTDRENVTTIEQNGVSPFGRNVGFRTDTETPASTLAGLVSGPNKTNRESAPVALDPSLAGRAQAANVTTINRNPNGPVPQRTVDTASELGRLAIDSRFNAPLADNPGAYSNSELANAITGEPSRAYQAPGNLENTRSIMSDPTAGTIAPSPSGNIGTFVESPMISGPGKTNREVAAEPLTSAPGKTDRVRDIIMGTAPVPRSNVLPFRNGVPGASLTRVANPSINTTPDSSLSPLATQSPPAGDNPVPSVTPQERQLQPSRPVSAPSPVPGAGIAAISPAERQRFMSSQPVPAQSPVFNDLQTEMDAANPDAAPAKGYIGTITPEQDAAAGTSSITAPEPGAGGSTDTTGGTPSGEPGSNPPPSGDTSTEYLPGIMPWDRGAYQEIAKAYEAAGLTYSPQQFQAAFYNEQSYVPDHPAADTEAMVPDNMTSELYGGIMPWDRQAYNQLRKSYEAIGQAYTPQQFIAQFYATEPPPATSVPFVRQTSPPAGAVDPIKPNAPIRTQDIPLAA